MYTILINNIDTKLSTNLLLIELSYTFYNVCRVILLTKYIMMMMILFKH